MIGVAALLALTLANNATVSKCSPIEVSSEYQLALKWNESGGFEFKAPAELDENGLTQIWFQASPLRDSSNPGRILSVPLGYESKDGLATGRFLVSSGWVRITVVAVYGDAVCGPRLSKSMDVP